MSAREAKPRHFPVFWVCLLVFLILMAAFWTFIIRYVHSCMVLYEAAQPQYLGEQVIAQIKDGTLVERMQFPSSRFEEPSAARDAYLSRLDGKELTWVKAVGSYDAQAPVYELRAGNDTVAKVTLREKSSQVLMLILTLQEWEIDNVAPVLPDASSWTVTAPDTYTVTVNGMPLDERERTGAHTELEQFQYAAEYVAVPALVEYRIDGLYQEPEILATDPQGRTVPFFCATGHDFSTDIFLPSDMPEDLSAQVLKNAKDYSNFFSSDLPGSGASTRPLRHMFPDGSYYLDLAENYRRHDMWMYSNHSTPTFSDEQVTNYIRYTDDLFSCDVSFDKKMILTKTKQERHDITNTRYYYVNIEGSWVIADMQQILDGEQGGTN